MAEPDPAGIGGVLGGGEESSPIFRGQTEVKIDYKDVTGLTKQMTALADAIKKVHTALGSLDDGKSRKALANLKGIGGSGAGGANGGNGGGATFAGDEKPGSEGGKGGNGGFTGITRRQYAIGSVFAGASLLAGAYDRRMQGDLTSDVLAMRTVYTSDRPSFGLHEATRYNTQRFGPTSLGREDAQQGAAAVTGRYGAPYSRGAEAAARGTAVFSMTSLQGSAYGAEMYNALNSPDVLNRMRMFTGYSTGQVTNVTDFNNRMAKAVFNSASPTNAQLSGLRPGTPGYESLLMLSGGNQGLMQTQIELMRAKQRYQTMGSPRGPWNDSIMTRLNEDKGLQKELFGENSLFLSRQRFEAGKGMRQEELLNMSRSGLVTTNELLATISSNTFEMTKHLQALAGPLGNLLGGLGGGMGMMGQVANIGTDILTLRALTGGGGMGGGAGFLRGVLGARGGAGLLGRGGALGLGAAGAPLMMAAGGALGGQLIDSMIGNPKDKEGVDTGNILRQAATGAGIGAAVGSVVPILGTGVGAAVGGAVGGGIGAVREFFGGDPIDMLGRGGIGDPTEDQPMPGGGMTVSEAEAILKSRGGHTSGISGLAADFKVKLGQLFKMNPKLSLSSGARTMAEQQRLYDRWVRKVPGQAPAAKPGTSNHEFGLAADIGPSSEYGWLAAHAPQVGLVKPMDYEPWHWEPPGAKARRGAPVDTQGGSSDTGQTAVKPSVLAAAVTRVTGIGGSKAGKGPRAPALSGVAITSAGEGLSVQGSGATEATGGGTPWKGGAGSISINEAARAARAAGVPENQIALAVALGMAESSLNPQAHNAKPPDDSYGIWQINMLGGMGPDRRKALGINSNDALFDPNVNAKAMAMISGGGHNWRPWSTYTSGAYKGHMAAVESALKTGVGDPVDMGPSGQQAVQLPAISMMSRGGGGASIVAPIYVTVQNASDEEAQRFARQVKRHLEGIVADIDHARTGT